MVVMLLATEEDRLIDEIRRAVVPEARVDGPSWGDGLWMHGGQEMRTDQQIYLG